jgi:hypothetical protein
VGGSESRKRAANAFGTFTGYAESLKEDGMVKTNLAGEDMVGLDPVEIYSCFSDLDFERH